MRIRTLAVAAVLCAAAACVVAAAAGARATAGTITVKVKVTGATNYSGTWTHAIDAKQTIPAKYSCVNFTAPSLPVKGRPFAYNVDFANDKVLQRKAPAMFFAFYFTKAKLGRPQPVSGIQGGASILFVPKTNKTYGIQDITVTKISVNLRPDLKGGTFTAQGLDGVLPTSGKVNVTGSWNCTSLYQRAT
jgi:hypothetical protein